MVWGEVCFTKAHTGEAKLANFHLKTTPDQTNPLKRARVSAPIPPTPPSFCADVRTTLGYGVSCLPVLMFDPAPY